MTTANSKTSESWLEEYKAKAEVEVARLEMPTRYERPWKYTDLSELKLEELTSLADESASTTVKTNSEKTTACSLLEGLADPRKGSWVRKHLGTLIPPDEDLLLASNSLSWKQGIYISSADRDNGEVTIDINLAGETDALHPRILIEVEKSASLSVLIQLNSDNTPLVVLGAIEIFLAANAKLELNIVNKWGIHLKEFTTVRAELAEGSDLSIATIALGGSVVKHRYDVSLLGERAHSDVKGVAVGDGSQHFDFMTVQEHSGRQSTSDVGIKTALAGQSRAVYYGITRVLESAGGSSANQENRNMLLASNAKADSDPVLEILTNDVSRCGHGATVGPVDDDGLFYLMSRGLDKRSALKMLVAGFMAPIIDTLKDSALSDSIREDIDSKLENSILD
jgi:Fe-S cluster assembly protein SufD